MDRIAPLTARLVVRAFIPQLLTRPVALVVTVAVAVTVAEVRVITKLLPWVVAVLVVLLALVEERTRALVVREVRAVRALLLVMVALGSLPARLWLLARLASPVLPVTLRVVLLVRLALVVM